MDNLYWGGVAGIIFGRQPQVVDGIYSTRVETVFVFSLALTYWIAFFISGTLLLGFAEIITLLQELVDVESYSSSNIVNSIKNQYKEKVGDNDQSSPKSIHSESKPAKPSSNQKFNLAKWKKDNS